MKYFCKLKLSKAKVNELVYADGPKDAEAIARANIITLMENWDETFMSAEIFSFYDLGQMACNFHPEITFAHGLYYFSGRKINDDINFNIGFADAFHHNRQELIEEEETLYMAKEPK